MNNRVGIANVAIYIRVCMAETSARVPIAHISCLKLSNVVDVVKGSINPNYDLFLT